jgi:hypothetical protein
MLHFEKNRSDLAKMKKRSYFNIGFQNRSSAAIALTYFNNLTIALGVS